MVVGHSVFVVVVGLIVKIGKQRREEEVPGSLKLAFQIRVI